MTRRDEYDETPDPAQVYLQLQRERAAQRNFVTPAPLATRQPQTIDAPAWLATSQQTDVANVWAAPDGARENTSAMDRARALRVRLLPFVLLWALLAVIVFVVVLFVIKDNVGSGLTGLLAFTALTAFTYYRLNRTDYDYSREGTERHRIDSATYLAERELDHKARMQEKALDSYLRQIEGRNR